MATIFLVSGMEQPPTPPILSLSGGHVVAYAGLAFLVVRALSGGLPPKVTRTTALWTLGITIAYGISDELHQLFVPGRTADALDVVADAVGGLLGVGACRAWDIIRSPKAHFPNPN